MTRVVGGETHHHDDEHALSDIEIRVRALESLLVEKGYVEPASLDAIVDLYEHKIGPRNGAKVVAKAWTDPLFRDALFADGTKAIASLGFTGRQGEHITALENTVEIHNLVVCTLCSCYPWPVLGLPPAWYKSAPYRARAVIDPEAVLREFGVEMLPHQRVAVWDSNSEMRYLVVPMRPANTDSWSEDRLASLVTRNSMIGVGVISVPAGTESAE